MNISETGEELMKNFNSGESRRYLETYRDAVLKRIFALHKRAIELSRPELVDELRKCHQIARVSRMSSELGLIDIGLELHEALLFS